MGGLFSGFRRSSEEDKKPAKSVDQKIENNALTKGTTRADTKKAPPKKNTDPLQTSSKKAVKKQPTIKPSVSQAVTSKTNTDNNIAGKQPHSERSPSMRLSKNTPKKVDNDFDIPADPIAPSPSYTSSSTNIGTKVEPKVTPCATIGPKISFKGELSGEEDLLVQGYVEGSISLKNNHLTIGRLGTVKANISAKTITVEGTVEGDIVGQEKVEIKTTSNVNGNLKADRVTLEDGAKFRGSIDMGSSGSQNPKPSTPAKASEAPKSTSSLSSESSSSGSVEKKPDTV